MNRVYLFGNGLSIAHNDEQYRLPNLTRRVRRRLSRMEGQGDSLLGDLEDLVQRLGADDDAVQDIESDFERLAGPLDRLAETIGHIATMERLVPEPEARTLRSVGERMRSTYIQIVGCVLAEIVERSDEQSWEAINAVARHLLDQAREEPDAALEVFNLNYDSLLHSGLIQVSQRAYGRARLFDEFSGVESHTFQVDGTPVRFLAYRTDFYTRDRSVHLHHLHGAASWIRRGSLVYKAQHLDDVRDAGLYGGWANGTIDDMQPVVVLGDQKRRQVTSDPFEIAYGRLSSAVAGADELVVAGYSFRDSAVNAAIKRALRPNAVVWVLDPLPPRRRVLQERLGVRREHLRVVRGSLPDALEHVE